MTRRLLIVDSLINVDFVELSRAEVILVKDGDKFRVAKNRHGLIGFKIELEEIEEYFK